MPWICRFDERTRKDFRKLDKQIQSQILDYLEERISGDTDPRRFGKGLQSNLSGLWCYRVGNYRVVCQLKDSELLVLVVSVGRRKDVYG